MDEKDEKLELNLDDIMEEFHTEPDETLEEEVAEWKASVFGEETVPEEEQIQEPQAADEEIAEESADAQNTPVDLGETRPFTPVSEPAVSSDTIRFDTIRLDTASVLRGQVHNAVPVEEEEPEEQSQEPFSEQWEPEYEQPMGEYGPVQHIIAHPRSRLRELKKKLVAGPEKRYYDLMEKGMGKLQIAIFLSVLVVLISALSTVMYAMGMVQENRIKLLIFGQLFAMLLSALLGSNQIVEGICDLGKKRFSVNTLMVLTFLVCCADGVFCLQQLRVPCCAAFSLQVTMSLWSEYQRRSAEMGKMDTMRKATHLESVVATEDPFNIRKCFLRGEGQVEDFMDRYAEQPKPEKHLDRYALIAAVLSLAVGVTAGILKRDVSAALQVFAVTLLAAVPVTSFIAVSRPAAVLERRLHAIGTVICGWSGVEKMCGKAAFPVTFDDLFPAGTCRMNGVKFFGTRQPDEIVAYCTALMEAEGGGLTDLFTQVLESRNGKHYDAEDLTYYEGGIGGVVEGEVVLVGTLSFLKNMGVEIPEGIRVSQAVCVAVEGELCGLFAISMDRSHSAASALSTLCGHRKLRAVLQATDFVLTESFVRSKLGVNTRRMEFPDTQTREALAQLTAEDQQTLALVTREGLMPYAYAVTGARSLRTATRVGVIMSMIGGGLGIAMMLTLTVLGALQYLTPANMFLYQLLWLVPGLLITEWTRNI